MSEPNVMPGEAASKPTTPLPSRDIAVGLIAGVLAIGLIVMSHEAALKYTMATAGALVLLGVMISVRDLRLFTLYMLLLMAPLGLRQSFNEFPHLGGASAIFLEGADPFMLLLAYFQLRDRSLGYKRGYEFPKAFVFWSGMIVLGLGSVFLMRDLRISALNEVVRMLKLLLLACLILNEVRTIRLFKHVLVALFLGVVLQSSVAILEVLHGKQLGLMAFGEASDEDIKTLSDATFERARLSGNLAYRASGLLGHANLLACYLALLLPSAVALILTTFSPRIKLLLGAALLLGMPALVLTLSRAGWIDYCVAFVIVLTLGALNAKSRRRYRLTRVVIIVVTLVAALAMSPQIVRRLFETDPSAVEFRLKWLATARAMVLDHPVFGTGLNTYVYAQLPYGEDKTPDAMRDRYGKFWPAVHNTWMLTWSEQGTVGFALFVAIHISVLLVAVRNLRIRDPMMHALNVGLMAGFVGVMLDGMASFFVRVEAPARMFWIALALIYAVDSWRRANEADAAALEKSLPLPEPRPEADFTDQTRGKWLPGPSSPLR